MPSSGIVKYHVKLSYNVDGLVGRTDIIGAIFGQTEGLLGPDMNLNDLQKISKIGRIDVTTKSSSSTTVGEVLIPMSTDIDTCTLIAASIESIDKVGAFDCKFHLISIDDIRAAKKDDIVRRAKEIKRKISLKAVSKGDEMLREVHGGARGAHVSSYGPSKLPCGSGMLGSPWIILVEGRADIVNLIRAGYDNTLAIDGARIDESIITACKGKKRIVAFLDGDRTGAALLKELKSMVRVDVALRADEGVEVEELTPQRVADILDPAVSEIKEQFSRSRSSHETRFDRERGSRNGERGRDGAREARRPSARPPDKDLVGVVSRAFPGLKNTLMAVAFDASSSELFRVPINEVLGKLADQSGIKYLLLDGMITRRLLESATGTGVDTIVGHRVMNVGDSRGVNIMTFSELGVS